MALGDEGEKDKVRGSERRSLCLGELNYNAVSVGFASGCGEIRLLSGERSREQAPQIHPASG